jgi:transcription-repair coupling factor (superfamily II helicase)
VRGDIVDVFPPYAENPLRIGFFGDEVELIAEISSLTGEVLREFDAIPIWPASHYVTERPKITHALDTIREELEGRKAELMANDRVLEAQRLAQRTAYDLEMLENMGWHAGCRKLKGGGLGVYIKNSNVIEEMLSVLGVNQALFSFINARIEREIKNAENRATNCVTSNIARAVDASARVREAIEALMRTNRLSGLPAELQETAELRMQNPSASLKELAYLHNPPITKSGLNHRLQKILTAGEAAQAHEKNSAE